MAKLSFPVEGNFNIIKFHNIIQENIWLAIITRHKWYLGKLILNITKFVSCIHEIDTFERNKFFMLYSNWVLSHQKRTLAYKIEFISFYFFLVRWKKTLTWVLCVLISKDWYFVRFIFFSLVCCLQLQHILLKSRSFSLIYGQWLCNAQKKKNLHKSTQEI